VPPGGGGKGETRMIITPEQACKSILEMMNKWADTVPEERRDDVFEKMFNVLSGRKPQGPKEKSE
jgi:hypothetical protein